VIKPKLEVPQAVKHRHPSSMNVDFEATAQVDDFKHISSISVDFTKI
jgi:hypothetical protein